VRCTISPEARRKVLSRLLALNHRRHAEEVEMGIADESGKPTKEGKRRLEHTRETGEKEGNFGRKQQEFDISMPGKQGELF
jgi:acyl-CoA reductase-like NAD-dependent aldehyde dehydrogenase